MTIGLPRALLYYRYHTLWEAFFAALGIETVQSGETDKRMLARGGMLAIDEACLSSKIYLGHVDALVGKCDAILVPRIATISPERGRMCTKFMALYDIAQSTFRDRGVQFLCYNVDVERGEKELSAFLKLGKQLSAKRRHALYAYMLGKQSEQIAQGDALREQRRQMERPGLKILIVGHPYNVYDAVVGAPVLRYLRAHGAIPVVADVVDKRAAISAAGALTDTLPWVLNRELVGGVQLYRDAVDGIILLSAFPCGPDSLVNEMILRRVRGLPMLNLIMDSQDGTAGLETRLESFLDIIDYRREVPNG